MTDISKKSAKVEDKAPTTAEVVSGFQRLRDEQRSIVGKISELDSDVSEHRLVIETLEGVDENRRCFRLMGSVLVERTVKEVLPALRHNKEQIEIVVNALKEQLKVKGEELNNYREKYGIRIQGEAAPSGNDTQSRAVSGSADSEPSAQGTSVLVSQD